MEPATGYTHKILKQGEPFFQSVDSLVEPVSQVECKFDKILLRSESMVHVRDMHSFALLQEWHRSSRLAALTQKTVLMADETGLVSRKGASREFSSRICFCQSDVNGVAVVGLQGYLLQVIDGDSLAPLASYTSNDYINTAAWQNSLALTGGEYLSCWDINKGIVKEMHSLNDDEIIALGISVNPGDINSILALGGDGVLGMLDPRSNQPIGRPKLLGSRPSPSITTTTSGFIVVHSAREIKVFDLVQFKVRCTFRTKQNITGLDTFGYLVLAMLENGDLMLFDIDTGKGRWGWGAGQNSGDGVWTIGNKVLVATDSQYGWLQFE